MQTRETYAYSFCAYRQRTVLAKRQFEYAMRPPFSHSERSIIKEEVDRLLADTPAAGTVHVWRLIGRRATDGVVCASYRRHNRDGSMRIDTPRWAGGRG